MKSLFSWLLFFFFFFLFLVFPWDLGMGDCKVRLGTFIEYFYVIFCWWFLLYFFLVGSLEELFLHFDLFFEFWFVLYVPYIFYLWKTYLFITSRFRMLKRERGFRTMWNIVENIGLLVIIEIGDFNAFIFFSFLQEVKFNSDHSFILIVLHWTDKSIFMY